MPHTEELLNKWMATRPNEKFVKDGIINITQWNKTQEKVLFLLKEINLAPGSYSDSLPFDVQRDFRKTANDAPWKEIGQWAYGVLYRHRHPVFEDAHDNRHFACRSVAIVNLKKVAGGNTANPCNVKKHALDDANFLRKQIDLISPKIIICCGRNLNFSIAREIFPDAYSAKLLFERKDFISGKLFKGERYFWVDYVHPQMRKGTHKDKYNSLLSLVTRIP